jgi:hypothetical protein
MISDVIEVVIRGNHDGNTVLNIFHIKDEMDLPFDGPNLNAGLKVAFCDALKVPTSDDFNWFQITSQVIAPVAQDPFLSSINVTGQAAGESLPSYCSIVVRKRTGLAGRKNRGRFFLTGIPEGAAVVNKLHPDSLTAYQGAMDTFLASFVAGGGLSRYHLGILHRIDAGVPVPPSAAAFVPVTSLSVDSFFGTTRSRKTGRGI